MMASRRQADGPKPLRRAKKTDPKTQYMILGGVFVALIVISLVVVGLAQKPAPKPVKKTAATDESSPSTRSRTSRSRSVARDADKLRREERDRRREERRRERERNRLEGRTKTTKRTGTGGYARTTGGNQLRAIVVDEQTGTRLALIGERRFRAGDEYSGRRITEVRKDEIRVTFGDNTYSVKVGQTVY